MTTISGLCLLGPGNPPLRPGYLSKLKKVRARSSAAKRRPKSSSSDSSGETLMLPGHHRPWIMSFVNSRRSAWWWWFYRAPAGHGRDRLRTKPKKQTNIGKIGDVVCRAKATKRSSRGTSGFLHDRLDVGEVFLAMLTEHKQRMINLPIRKILAILFRTSSHHFRDRLSQILFVFQVSDDRLRSMTHQPLGGPHAASLA